MDRHLFPSHEVSWGTPDTEQGHNHPSSHKKRIPLPQAAIRQEIIPIIQWKFFLSGTNRLHIYVAEKSVNICSILPQTHPDSHSTPFALNSVLWPFIIFQHPTPTAQKLTKPHTCFQSLCCVVDTHWFCCCCGFLLAFLHVLYVSHKLNLLMLSSRLS